METYLDILLERAEMVREWKNYVAAIARAAKTILPDSQVHVFGSAVKGEAVGGSDVDVLVVSNSIPTNNFHRAEVMMKIEELCGLPPYHPFEIHLVNEEEAKWYFDKVKELREYK